MEKILKRIYENKKLSRVLLLSSHFSSVCAVILFGITVIKLSHSSLLSALKFSLLLGIPFAVITVSRKFINAKRPYEAYGFYKVPPKNKKGLSFPSRHAFSAFAIAVASMPFLPTASAVMLVLAVVLSASRVLLGIHFIRDVLTGAVLGILTSIIGLLIFF